MKPISRNALLNEQDVNMGFMYGALVGVLLGGAVCGWHAATWLAWQHVAVLIAFTVATGAIGHLAIAARRRANSPADDWTEDSVWDRLADMGNTLDADD